MAYTIPRGDAHMSYKLIIGLEVHVELNTESKMFCSCSAEHFQVPANTHTCPTCLGLPGALPVVNQEACERCLKIGLALGCSLLDEAVFARKHYAYPDLAKGYQLSQYELPFCVEGKIDVKGRSIRIKRVHMEEDTGKLQHGDHNGQSVSFVDFNRAGVPLVEIVTEADFRSPEEVEEYARSLQRLMRYLGVSSADMEKGSMRFEANISLLKTDKDISGVISDSELPKYKVEVKNLNSFKALTGAVVYEMKRQQEILEKGDVPAQETRGWDDAKQKTYAQREKEEAHDYRYFPDPDISPMRWMQQKEEVLIKSMPELPWIKKARYMTQYALSEYDSGLITDDILTADWFEAGLKLIESNKYSTEQIQTKVKKLANILLSEVFRIRNDRGESGSPLTISVQEVLQVIEAVEAGKISTTNAKIVIEELYGHGGTTAEIITSRGLEQVTDMSVVENAVKKIIAEQPKAVADYKSGKETVIMFLIGMVMKELKGKGNTETIKELLKTNL